MINKCIVDDRRMPIVSLGSAPQTTKCYMKQENIFGGSKIQLMLDTDVLPMPKIEPMDYSRVNRRKSVGRYERDHHDSLLSENYGSISRQRYKRVPKTNGDSAKLTSITAELKDNVDPDQIVRELKSKGHHVFSVVTPSNPISHKSNRSF